MYEIKVIINKVETPFYFQTADQALEFFDFLVTMAETTTFSVELDDKLEVSENTFELN